MKTAEPTWENRRFWLASASCSDDLFEFWYERSSRNWDVPASDMQLLALDEGDTKVLGWQIEIGLYLKYRFRLDSKMSVSIDARLTRLWAHARRLQSLGRAVWVD